MRSPLEEKCHSVALARVPGIGPIGFKKLITHFGSAHQVWQAACHQAQLIPPRVTHLIRQHYRLDQAVKLVEEHTKNQIQVVSLGEKEYPKRLAELADPPPIIFYQGKPLLHSKRMITIVGTRSMSHYGKQAITHLMQGLAPYNPIIVSGLAYGVDAWVHQQALALGLATIAVVPTGLDQIYPRPHQPLAQQLAQGNGGLLTEYPMATPVKEHAFIKRNRIMAGIADLTIVIEANIKSGSLSTAYYANSYHKEVFALPGDLFRPTTGGTHQLIQRNQAHLVTKAEDIAYWMNWDQPITAPMQEAVHRLTPSEKAIITHLQHEVDAISIDTLLEQTNLKQSEIQATLLSLELQGWVIQLPGQRFIFKKGASANHNLRT